MSMPSPAEDLPEERDEDAEDGRTVFELREGRTLAVDERDDDDLIEVRGADGGIEVRIVLTEKGPVLQMESVRLSLKADESIDVKTGSFRVHTSEDLALTSDGGINIDGDADVVVNADGEVHVTGTMIYLN